MRTVKSKFKVCRYDCNLWKQSELWKDLPNFCYELDISNDRSVYRAHGYDISDARIRIIRVKNAYSWLYLKKCASTKSEILQKDSISEQLINSLRNTSIVNIPKNTPEYKPKPVYRAPGLTPAGQSFTGITAFWQRDKATIYLYQCCMCFYGSSLRSSTE